MVVMFIVLSCLLDSQESEPNTKGAFHQGTAESVNAKVNALSVLDGSLRLFVSEQLTAPLHQSVN
jgi:hypothetical protein